MTEDAAGCNHPATEERHDGLLERKGRRLCRLVAWKPAAEVEAKRGACQNDQRLQYRLNERLRILYSGSVKPDEGERA